DDLGNDDTGAIAGDFQFRYRRRPAAPSGVQCDRRTDHRDLYGIVLRAFGLLVCGPAKGPTDGVSLSCKQSLSQVRDAETTGPCRQRLYEVCDFVYCD